MRHAVSNEQIPVAYLDHFCEYGLKHPRLPSKFDIDYCPWCGGRLPASRRLEWFEILDDLGLDPGDSKIPEALLSGDWWRQGLYSVQNIKATPGDEEDPP